MGLVIPPATTFKDTTTVIQEWIQTEQLISEETTEWNIESCIIGYQRSFETEIKGLISVWQNLKRRQ